MFWTFVFAINTMLLAIGGMLFGAAYVRNVTLWVYPYWLTEMMVSYYWFGLVHLALKGTVYRDALQNDMQHSMIRRAGNLLLLHIAVAWTLSMAVLPAYAPLTPRLIIAYPGTALVILLIPLALFPRRYRKMQKKLESDRVSPSKIRKWAMKSETAQRFCERFPDCQVYAFDHAAKNTIATCLFLHRAPRPEREGLMEDVLLETPVDMNSKKPLEDRMQSMRYIFENGEGGSSVHHLDEEKSFDEYDLYARLDDETLHQFDCKMNRFPSLETVPFPVAIRNAPYEIV